MNNQEIIDALKEIKSKQAQIDRENTARAEAEALICQEFNVTECNNRRNASAVNYANITSRLNAEINELKKLIDESI